jgi:hypothetical protein
MKFKEFLIDAAMNPGVFKDVEERMGSIAKIGFEFEFLVDELSNHFQSPDLNADSNTFEMGEEDLLRDESEMLFSIYSNIAKDFSEQFQTKTLVHMEPKETDKQPGIWYLEPDTSIKGGYGLELVSPPLSLADALDYLPKVCNFISDNDFGTNESTGFHINVSVPNIAKTLDKTKLVLFMGEKYAAHVFNREANIFAAPQIDAILKSVKTDGRIPKSFANMFLTATKGIKLHKYMTVNFTHLTSEGYLEFRIAGGKDYHKRVSELRNTILRFVRAVEIACDPSLEMQEYIKKLTKLFNRAQDEIVPTDKVLFARFENLPGMALSAEKQFNWLKEKFRFGVDFFLQQQIILLIDSLFKEEDRKNISLSPLETGMLRKMVNDAKIVSKNVDAFYAMQPNAEAKSRRERFKRVFRI